MDKWRKLLVHDEELEKSMDEPYITINHVFCQSVIHTVRIAGSDTNTNTEISLVKERIINATQSMKKRTTSELGPDNEIVPNPPTAKKQRQKRLQPSAIGAPTTKLNKTASRGSTRDRKKTEKAKLNDMMGR